MNKKTSTVKKRHMEGISHSRIRKTAGLLHDFATLIKVDPIDLGMTLITKHEEFFHIVVILPEEKRFKLLHKLVADTVKKIKAGEIAHPLRCAV